VIRLGPLAGYPFEGPRLLGGWTAPPVAAVYAITYKPDAAKDRHAVIYVGHSDDLSAGRFPFKHPRASCWIKRAGSKWKLYVSTYEIPGGTEGHRSQITRELIATYHPGCNTEDYDHTWKAEWLLPPPTSPPPTSV
jgi:hypothetical protein